jgi:hypothetical protein
MKLQDICEGSLTVSLDTVASNIELATQIQVLLINLDLLEAPADGKFGRVSAASLHDFQKALKVEEPQENSISKATAKKLIEAKKTDLPTPAIVLNHSFASRIIGYMQLKNYKIDQGPKKYNIVYVEGCNEDGTPNADTPNYFNDRRTVIEVVGGVPEMVGNWQATCEPGDRYTLRPMNPAGAARIKFGQWKAWSVGIHGNSEPHEALVQVGDITVFRDANKDYSRVGDEQETGLFGVNQHWGFDMDQVGAASAGCLVGRMRKGHREFMALLKQDKRYIANSDYVFTTTVIPGDDLAKLFPV